MADAKKPSPMLIGVLVVGLVAVAWQYRGLVFGSPEAAAAAAEAQQIKIDSKVQSLKALPALQMEPATEQDSYSPVRNLFDFGTDPSIEQQRREAQRRAEEERKRQEAERQKRMKEEQEYVAKNGPRPVPPPPPPPPPVPPTFGYTYIGYAQRGRTDFVAFIDKRGGTGTNSTAVQVGDTIDNQFVIKKIDFDGIVLGYTDPLFKDRTETVRLVPQAPGRGTK